MSAIVRQSAEPNVTPMIDVLLVLLIVFMIAVVQGHRSMDVQLPEPCRSTCERGEAIVLEVLPGPTYRLNQRPVSQADLLGTLTMTYAGRPMKVLSVAGRPGSKYAEVVEAMDVARSAGVRVLSAVPRGY
jgi:biopolymer transport protein TolR